MIATLERARLDVATAGQVRRALRGSPWAWPEPSREALVRRAEIVAGLPVPALRVGQVPLLTVNPSGASIWSLTLGQQADGDQSEASLGQVAQQVWQRAAAALSRCLPLLWQPLRAAVSAPRCLRHVVAWVRQGHVEQRDRVLEGASLGLPFAVGIASAVFNRPIRDTIAMTGMVDDNGKVQAVDGIEAKVQVLVHQAPRIRSVLVPHEQVEKATRASDGRLAVVGVDRLQDAISLAWEEPLESVLVEAGASQRAEMVQSLFGLALSPRNELVDWGPVARTADLATRTWADLPEEDRQSLQVVRMIALRHDGTPSLDGLPSHAWLNSLPAPIRLHVVAHWVQQAVDAPGPCPDDALALASTYLVRGLDAHVPHLRLAGAIARLLAVTGEPQRALDLQTEAAYGLLGRFAWSDITFPLAEWLRLAGALTDEAAVGEAEQVMDRAAMVGIDETAWAYVRLGWCRAMVDLGTRVEEALGELEKMAADRSAPAHRIGCAHRYAARGWNQCGQALRACEHGDELHRLSGQAPVFRRYELLHQLDRACMVGDREEAGRALDALRSWEPGLVGNLERGNPDPQQIARWFPY